MPLEFAWELLSDYLFILHKGFEIKIHSFVLMPNHFHMICSDPALNLSKGMEYFMKETSKEMGRVSGTINKIWGGPFGSSLINSNLYFYHAYKYIYRNPVKAGLSSKVETYPYSTLQVLLGQRKSVIPMMEDTILFDGSLEKNLIWLNTDYSEAENDSIRGALRRKTFKFARDKGHGKSVSLEDWSSIQI